MIIIIMVDMPALNLRKALYDEIIRKGEDPTKLLNELVEKHLKEVRKA